MNAEEQTVTSHPPDAGPLHTRLRSIKRKILLLSAVTIFMSVSVNALLLLSIGMACDLAWDLSRFSRLGILLLAAVSCSGAAWYFRPDKSRLTEDAIALRVERALPSFEGRFIAAIQLARSRDTRNAPGLFQALVAETSALSSRLDFTTVVDGRDARRMLSCFAGALALCAVFFLTSFERNLALLQRAFLMNVPVPRATRFTSFTKTAFLGAGDDLPLQATVLGVIPHSGIVNVISDSGRASQFPMDAEPSHAARFHHIIENVQESFSYTLHVNDAATSPIHVTVLPQPIVSGLECQEIYPPYTHLAPVPVSLTNLTLLAGSHLGLRVTAGSPIRAGSIHMEGAGSDIPLTVDRDNSTRLSGSIPIAQDARGFSVRLTDLHGIVSRNAAVHRFDIVRDMPPVVKMISPENPEELATPQATLRVAFEASDDFGVDKVALRYAIKPEEDSRVDSPTGRTVYLDITGQNPRKFSTSFDWKIQSLQPPPQIGAVLEYWIEVFDGNDVTGPGVSATPHYRASIVSGEDKKAELAGRLSQSFRQLEEAAGMQEKLNKEIGVLIGKP